MEDVGTVITIPIKDGDIWSGMEVLLCTGGNVIDIVKVDHLTIQGKFYVIGETTSMAMTDDMYLSYLYIKSKESLHKIKRNQWKQIIKSKVVNANRAVIFTLLPSTFSEGYTERLCTECGSYFSANKRQYECLDCAEKNRYAKVDLSELPKRAKRKRIIIEK